MTERELEVKPQLVGSGVQLLEPDRVRDDPLLVRERAPWSTTPERPRFVEPSQRIARVDRDQLISLRDQRLESARIDGAVLDVERVSDASSAEDLPLGPLPMVGFQQPA